MEKKTIILERRINNRIHHTRLSRMCHLHIEIIEELFYRLSKTHAQVDIESICDHVIQKF